MNSSDDELRASLRATLSLSETEAASFDIERFLSTAGGPGLMGGARSRWSRFKHCCRIDREDDDDMEGEDSSTSDPPALLGVGGTSSTTSTGGLSTLAASQAQVARSYRRLTRWRRAYALTRRSTDSIGNAATGSGRMGSIAGRQPSTDTAIQAPNNNTASTMEKSLPKGPENAHRPQQQVKPAPDQTQDQVEEDDMYTILIKLPESSTPASTNSSTNSSNKPLIQMIARNPSSKVSCYIGTYLFQLQYLSKQINKYIDILS